MLALIDDGINMFSENAVIDFVVDGVNYMYSHASGTVHYYTGEDWLLFCKIAAAEVPDEEYLISEIRYRNQEM